MLPTPMKAMKPATGKTMPAGPVAKVAKKRGGLGGAIKGAIGGAMQRPPAASAPSAPPQSVLGGARLLPQQQPHQAGSVRANAMRQQQMMQEKQRAMQQGAGEQGMAGLGEVPQMADRMQQEMNQRTAALGGMNPGMQQNPQIQDQMQRQMMKQRIMQAMQQQQGRGMPQNMGEIQSLLPPGMGEEQMQGVAQGMQDPNAGRFMGAMGPYQGAGMMGGSMRNFSGFDPRFGGG
jgi:hypothetical protein